MPVCILLADHWSINPNELLMLAGWPTLKAFDIHTKSAAHLPPEAVQVAKEIARISNPGTRKTVAEAILVLVRKYKVWYCLEPVTISTVTNQVSRQ
jgi:hypothetical protein